MVTVLLIIGAIVSSAVSYRAGKRSIVIPEYQKIAVDSTPPDCKHILEYLTPEDRKLLETALEKAEPRLSQAAFEPIPFDDAGNISHEELTLQSVGKDIFIIRHDDEPFIGYMKVTSSDDYPDNVDVYFSIVKGDYDVFYIHGVRGAVSRETFIDFVSHNYPDHFEWFLFHPEWL